MIIEWVDIQTLQENKDNPRTISEEKFRALCKSLEEFPAMLELRPIIIKGNVVIGGNMRLKASAKVGLKKVPIIRADSFTEDQIRQFIVKDNLSYGEFNMDLLGALYDLPELQEWGMDFPELNTDEIEIESGPLETTEKKKLTCPNCNSEFTP